MASCMGSVEMPHCKVRRKMDGGCTPSLLFYSNDGLIVKKQFSQVNLHDANVSIVTVRLFDVSQFVTEIECKKADIAAKSKYFRKCFKKNRNIDRVDIRGIKFESISSVIDHLLNNFITIHTHNMVDIFHLAHYFQVPDLIEQAKFKLLRNVNMTTCVSVWKALDKHPVYEKDTATVGKYILMNLENPVILEAFTGLNLKKVVKFLHSCHEINGEEYVFAAAMKWIYAEKNNSMKHSSHKVLLNVKLPLIGQEYLTRTVAKEPLFCLNALNRNFLQESLIANKTKLLDTNFDFVQRYHLTPRKGNDSEDTDISQEQQPKKLSSKQRKRKKIFSQPQEAKITSQEQQKLKGSKQQLQLAKIIQAELRQNLDDIFTFKIYKRDNVTSVVCSKTNCSKRSLFVREMFDLNPDMKFIELTKKNNSVFDVIEYLNTEKIAMNETNMIEFLEEAEAFQVIGLIEQIKEFLMDNIRPSNCLYVRKTFLNHNLEIYAQEIDELIVKHFHEFVESEYFLDMELDHLTKIISSPNLNIKNVDEVVTQWISSADTQDKLQQILLIKSSVVSRVVKSNYTLLVNNINCSTCILIGDISWKYKKKKFRKAVVQFMIRNGICADPAEASMRWKLSKIEPEIIILDNKKFAKTKVKSKKKKKSREPFSDSDIDSDIEIYQSITPDVSDEETLRYNPINQCCGETRICSCDFYLDNLQMVDKAIYETKKKSRRKRNVRLVNDVYLDDLWLEKKLSQPKSSDKKK